MRYPCKVLQNYLEIGDEALPAELQTHLTECTNCQRMWRAEQAYRRALRAARDEPTPVCDLPWSQIQARLTAPALARPRLPVRRFVPAFGIGAAALVALATALLYRLPETELRTLSAQGPTVQLATCPCTTVQMPRTVAQATPRHADTIRLQTPAVATPALPDRAEFSERVPAPLAVSATEAAPATKTAQAAVTVLDEPVVRHQRAGAPNAAGSERAESLALSAPSGTPPYPALEHAEPLASRMPSPTEAPRASLPTQIASLPLNRIRLLEGDDAYYLPFNYGIFNPGGNEHDETAGSF